MMGLKSDSHGFKNMVTDAGEAVNVNKSLLEFSGEQEEDKLTTVKNFTAVGEQRVCSRGTEEQGRGCSV